MKTRTGCLVAILLLLALFGLIALIQIGIAVYFAQSMLAAKEAASGASASASSSQSFESVTVMDEKALDALRSSIFTSDDGAFVRDRSITFEGRYLPKRPVEAEGARLDAIEVGPFEAFTVFETGERLMRGNAPLRLVFTPAGSQTSVDAYCTSYRLTRDAIACDGYNNQIGTFSFYGKADAGFLAELNTPNHVLGSSDKDTLTGSLTIGRTTLKSLTFSFEMAD